MGTPYAEHTGPEVRPGQKLFTFSPTIKGKIYQFAVYSTSKQINTPIEYAINNITERNYTTFSIYDENTYDAPPIGTIEGLLTAEKKLLITGLFNHTKGKSDQSPHNTTHISELIPATIFALFQHKTINLLQSSYDPSADAKHMYEDTLQKYGLQVTRLRMHATLLDGKSQDIIMYEVTLPDQSRSS